MQWFCNQFFPLIQITPALFRAQPSLDQGRQYKPLGGNLYLLQKFTPPTSCPLGFHSSLDYLDLTPLEDWPSDSPLHHWAVRIQRTSQFGVPGNDSVGTACDSSSRGYEFKPNNGCRAYLRKRKNKKQNKLHVHFTQQYDTEQVYPFPRRRPL